MGREVMRTAPEAEDQSDASTSQGMLETASRMMKLGGSLPEEPTVPCNLFQRFNF